LVGENNLKADRVKFLHVLLGPPKLWAKKMNSERKDMEQDEVLPEYDFTPDSESVNQALRALITIAPKKVVGNTT